MDGHTQMKLIKTAMILAVILVCGFYFYFVRTNGVAEFFAKVSKFSCGFCSKIIAYILFAVVIAWSPVLIAFWTGFYWLRYVVLALSYIFFCVIVNIVVKEKRKREETMTK